MANYNSFHSTVAALEGGYQKLKSDSGNYNSRNELVGTNYGIAAKTYEAWLGRVVSENDMRNITKSVASEIFKANYWNKLGANYINNQAIAENLVDHGINAGTGTAAKIMQGVLNNVFNINLQVDGGIGTLSIEAINNVNSTQLFKEFSKARLDYYKRIGNSSWLKVWINRVDTLANKFSIDISDTISYVKKKV